MTNPNKPEHEDSLKDVLGKLLEVSWPRGAYAPRPITDLTPDEVDTFSKKVNSINDSLPAAWFELSSWLIGVQDQWLDVQGSPPNVTPDDWAATVDRAWAVLRKSPDPQLDLDTLAKIEKLKT